MNSLSENQQRILDFLLEKHEGATLEDLSDLLGITKTAVKEHVLKLLSRDYLAFSDSKGVVGRPKRRYHLTDAGMEVFPRQYSWLSMMLLELLAEDMGAAAVSKIMRSLADKIAVTMKSRFTNLPIGPKRFQEISNILNELGYRSSVKQSDLRKGVVIEATNCVYHSVAKTHPELCQFDTRLIEKISGLSVKLEACIARGGSVCRFCIKG